MRFEASCMQPLQLSGHLNTYIHNMPTLSLRLALAARTFPELCLATTNYGDHWSGSVGRDRGGCGGRLHRRFFLLARINTQDSIPLQRLISPNALCTCSRLLADVGQCDMRGGEEFALRGGGTAARRSNASKLGLGCEIELSSSQTRKKPSLLQWPQPS